MYSMTFLLFVSALLVVDPSSVLADQDLVHYYRRVQLAAQRVCEYNNADDEKLQVIQAHFNEFEECFPRLFNIEALLRNMLVAKLNNTVPEVTRRECARSSQAKACMKTMTDGAAVCAGADSRNELNVLLNIFNRGLDFACSENGRPSIQFVENNGVECIAENSEQVVTCTDTSSYSSMEILASFDQMSNCFVSKISSCRIPAYTVRRLFNYARQAIPSGLMPVSNAYIHSTNYRRHADSSRTNPSLCDVIMLVFTHCS